MPANAQMSEALEDARYLSRNFGLLIVVLYKSDGKQRCSNRCIRNQERISLSVKVGFCPIYKKVICGASQEHVSSCMNGKTSFRLSADIRQYTQKEITSQTE